jgi:hypothetical protein
MSQFNQVLTLDFAHKDHFARDRSGDPVAEVLAGPLRVAARAARGDVPAVIVHVKLSDAMFGARRLLLSRPDLRQFGSIEERGPNECLVHLEDVEGAFVFRPGPADWSWEVFDPAGYVIARVYADVGGRLRSATIQVLTAALSVEVLTAAVWARVHLAYDASQGR